jgi:hypothetical protein
MDVSMSADCIYSTAAEATSKSVCTGSTVKWQTTAP